MGRVKATRDVLIQTPRTGDARAFYEGVLGLTVFLDDPTICGLEAGAFRLFIEYGSPQGPVMEFLVDDVEAEKTRLMSAGCVLVEEDQAVPRCHLRDPFGLTFNIARRV